MWEDVFSPRASWVLSHPIPRNLVSTAHPTLVSPCHRAGLQATRPTWTSDPSRGLSFSYQTALPFLSGHPRFKWERWWPFHSAARGQTRTLNLDTGGEDGTWGTNGGERYVEAGNSFLQGGILTQGFKMSKTESSLDCHRHLTEI